MFTRHLKTGDFNNRYNDVRKDNSWEVTCLLRSAGERKTNNIWNVSFGNKPRTVITDCRKRLDESCFVNALSDLNDGAICSTLQVSRLWIQSEIVFFEKNDGVRSVRRGIEMK